MYFTTFIKQNLKIIRPLPRSNQNHNNCTVPLKANHLDTHQLNRYSVVRDFSCSSLRCK